MTTTITDVLAERAHAGPDRVAFTWSDGERDLASLTYRQLAERARGLADRLVAMDLAGERALLVFAPGLDYVVAFFGCLMAGVTAVPVYPPDPGRLQRTLPRLVAITADARPAVALTTRDILPALAASLPTQRWIATDAPAADDVPAERERARARPDDLAFIQYTSGSTAAPKGVEITHRALMANLEVIAAAFVIGPASRGVFWLPLYHDMGLVGGVLGTVASGGTSTLMSPLVFLQRPIRWLREIARTRATVSGGPNFAFDLCVRKTTAEERAALDLSSWQLAFDGAEPVRSETLTRFADAFAPAGFRREALYPCYGLAEATLFVAGGRWSGPARTSGGAPAIGTPARGHDVVIIDGDGSPRPDGAVGAICVRGPSVARGYWGRPEESAAAFGLMLPDGRGPWLRTGDVGFMHEGRLHVTGREKDLVIVRGRNLYPQDLERAAEAAHSAVRPGCTGAFAVALADEEGLVVVAELERSREHEREAVSASITRALVEHAEVRPHRVVLVRHGTIPKTSSGKIQRHACREGFLAGTLEVLA